MALVAARATTALIAALSANITARLAALAALGVLAVHAACGQPDSPRCGVWLPILVEEGIGARMDRLLQCFEGTMLPADRGHRFLQLGIARLRRTKSAK